MLVNHSTGWTYFCPLVLTPGMVFTKTDDFLPKHFHIIANTVQYLEKVFPSTLNKAVANAATFRCMLFFANANTWGHIVITLFQGTFNWL